MPQTAPIQIGFFAWCANASCLRQNRNVFQALYFSVLRGFDLSTGGNIRRRLGRDNAYCFSPHRLCPARDYGAGIEESEWFVLVCKVQYDRMLSGETSDQHQ